MPNPDADKVSESELSDQQCQDAQLMDKDFGTWHDKKFREGSTAWKKHTEMYCDHGEVLKDHQNHNPVSPPLDYMKAHGVFKAKKTNAYDLCHFYCVSASGDFPTFPNPCEPASCNMLEWLLEVVWAVKHANLLMAFVGDSAMSVCLLRE